MQYKIEQKIQRAHNDQRGLTICFESNYTANIAVFVVINAEYTIAKSVIQHRLCESDCGRKLVHSITIALANVAGFCVVMLYAFLLAVYFHRHPTTEKEALNCQELKQIKAKPNKTTTYYPPRLTATKQSPSPGHPPSHYSPVFAIGTTPAAVVLYRPVITFEFFSTLLECPVVAVCGQQLGNLSVHFLIPCCSVELPLYLFVSNQTQKCLHLFN